MQPAPSDQVFGMRDMEATRQRCRHAVYTTEYDRAEHSREKREKSSKEEQSNGASEARSSTVRRLKNAMVKDARLVLPLRPTVSSSKHVTTEPNPSDYK